MKYYMEKLYLAQVDKNNAVIGQVERWQAHEKGILHRGFTVILFYDNQIVLQHRRHPAFDKFWDMTFSSHPIYINNVLQPDSAAIADSLKREWSIDENGLDAGLKFLGKIYYKAKDPHSVYTEHEIDYIYLAELKDKPRPNPEYAYSFELVSKLEIENRKLKIDLTPWVEKIIEGIDIL